MKINGIEIDASKLISKRKLLAELKYDATDKSLAVIRSRYFKAFGNELIWRYPLSDGEHNGVTIVVIKEGFYALPYYDVEKDYYELFELDKAYFLGKFELENFIGNWKRFSDDLSGSLGDMLNIVCNQ